jgi:hypothetical protein
VLRAAAAGGWRGLPGGGAAELSAGPGRLRARLLADEAVVDGDGATTDLGATLEELAGMLGVDLPPPVTPSPEALLDAALAGGAGEGAPAPGVLAAAFGRPAAFRVLVSGDIPPDSVGALAAAALARVRTAPESMLLVADSTETLTPQRGRTLRHDGDGRGERALVGFRGRVAGPTAERRPDQVRAGLEVLAQLLRAALGGSAEVDTRVAWDGASATLVVEAAGEPDAAAARILEAAGRLDVTEAAVARARGAAVRAHERAVSTPEGWIEWLHFLSGAPVDPRAAHNFPATLRAVPLDRVRALAEALLDTASASVVMVAE